MKGDAKEAGFFRRALGALTNNWGLKLLALLLALIIYHSLRHESGRQRLDDDRQFFQYR